MGFGILEDHKLPNVPGTVVLDDEVAHVEGLSGLKHAKGKGQHVVLVPQPSEDPNDPLNWPLWKKEMITWILCFGAILNCATNGPFLNASYVAIAERLQTPLTSVVVLSGYNLLAAGATGPLYCALSRRYGKRPCFLASTLFCIIGTAIGESKISFNYLRAARVIQGFSTSAFESLTVSAIGDMYFVHQRGLRVSILTFNLYAASGLASIICGQVFDRLGWLWLFHLFQIFVIIQFVLMFFFCPETSYIRDHLYDIDNQQEEKLDELLHLEEITRVDDKTVQRTISRESQTPSIPRKKTFVQELAIYTRVYSRDNLLKLIFGPWLALLNPGACYSIVCAGILSSFYVGASIFAALVFSGPPWLYNVSQVAYIGTGPFVGGMIGSIIMTLVFDRASTWMARLNNGVYEPEFRLVFMLPTMIIYAVGTFLYGHFMNIGAAGPLCSFFWGVMQCGIVFGLCSTTSYALDAFREDSNEIFILAMLFKNFLFYGYSYFVNNWVVEKGISQVMNVFGGVGVFFCLLAIVFYAFGKRLRSWWSRHNLFRMFNMHGE
ncbi:uncharacterized protein A1O5_13380 [Cladophialophora psammophila CBS 110553]|uniref:Major facilitator superfamily (MFS) profile domain-containing protein n=1 Tax=Cladophialophora psammophila CBS 110553 TaxID=1182543 RepID=W9VMQ3_9EURO|nr:uncharacterized protein A1O5_13380 [Cladophialophora psammophila CBS 110553]EXJ53391.1 hypothetical protein A1O5_13380 [Cladophialophora psammophila CBS 110553]